MPLPSISLAVVGADYPNKRGPGRRFEIAICVPGEQVELIPEPKNPADPRAVAVYSCRGILMGYLSAERCGRIGSIINTGQEVVAVFQERASYGAVIRAAFGGQAPDLPHQPKRTVTPDDDFWPDQTWPDD